MSILGEEPVVLRRYSAGENVDGKYVEGQAEDLPILMSVQPVTGRQLEMLPEGKRAKEVLVGYTEHTDIRTVEQGDQADQVLVDGIAYEVHSRKHYRAVIPHASVMLVRVDGQ